MKSFKFRSECFNDILEFMKLHGEHIGKIGIQRNESFPDCECTFTSELDRGELIEKLRDVVDGHVMVQTLEEEENYTGNRDYDR